MDVGPATFAVVDLQGQQAEDEEETSHPKADFIDRRVPHQGLAGVPSFNACTEIFKKRNLREKEREKLPVRTELERNRL